MTKRYLPAVCLSMVIACILQQSAQADPRLVVTSAQQTWTTETWAGDANPYRAIRLQIDTAFRDGQLTSDLIEHYWAQREQHPRDPQALFRWVYACRQAQQMHPPPRLKQVPGPGAFQYVPSPHTYEYTRLRFLSNTDFPNPSMKGVATRLLQQQANDYDVRYALLHCFKLPRTAAEKQEALSDAEFLTRHYSAKPSAYAALGSVYFDAWLAEPNQADGDKAVAAYQKYLKLAPSYYEWRGQAQKIVALLRTHQYTQPRY